MAETGHESLSLVLVDLTAEVSVVRWSRRLIPRARTRRSRSTARQGRFKGATGQGWSFTEKIFDRAAIYLAFEQVGGAKAALDMAFDYSQNRFAFGRAIGLFQAIKHKLVNIL